MLPHRSLIAIGVSLLVFSYSGMLNADIKADVGYQQLLDELGTAVPTGAGVPVTQVEAPNSSAHWMPDTGNTQFSGKTIVDKTGDSGTSNHATTVGIYFYGNSSSLSPSISDIDLYAVSTSDTGDDWWLTSGYLGYGVVIDSIYYPVQPYYQLNPLQLASPSRVANHSWVSDTSADEIVLRRVDFAIHADEFIQVAAVNNGTVQYPLLSGAFNAITVGRTDAGHATGTILTDSIYTEARVCPLIVAPASLTSYAAPLVASAAALLVQVGRDTDLGNDPDQTYTLNRSGQQIANAERSETIKAALLAGACRITSNTATEQIIDYRSNAADRSDSGLDNRFGAGQLDIYQSYRIVAAGEHNSIEDDAGAGDIEAYGFDVDPFFGGLNGCNTSASYVFTAGPEHRRLYASLVWHLKIDGGVWYDYDDTATLYNIDLALYDISAAAGERLVAASADSTNNTENLWVAIVPGRRYRLEVTRANGQDDFQWDFALAWRMGTPLDRDEDGIDDDWEVQHGLDITDPSDAAFDPDNDGLDNLGEYLAGTALNDSDTDGDTISDGVETAAGTDPLDADDLPGIDVSISPIGIWMVMAGLLLIGSRGSFKLLLYDYMYRAAHKVASKRL